MAEKGFANALIDNFLEKDISEARASKASPDRLALRISKLADSVEKARQAWIRYARPENEDEVDRNLSSAEGLLRDAAWGVKDYRRH